MYLRPNYILSLLVAIFFVEGLHAQDNSNLTHYFMNPYTINPSFAGADGKASVFLTYRKQWVDIDGAPTISNFSFHSPVGKKVGFGANITNADRGILNTTSAYLTASYGISFSKTTRLRFAVSGGAAYNGFDITEVENAATDPALQGLLENNIYVIGNAGVSLQHKTLNFGISIPNFFTDEYFSDQESGVGEPAPFESALIFLSNRFYFGNDRHVFEPFVLYRYSNIKPPQIEASAAIHLNHVVWFGGSYKQDFGISAFGGIKLQKSIGIGYAYSLKNTGINEINSPTHEIQLNILFGNRDKNTTFYSFVDTSKPVMKTRRQLALEKKREEAALKRKEAELERQALERLKKEDEAREKERLAEEARKAEEERIAEARKAEEARVAEEERQKEEQKRLAEEKRQLEQQQKLAEEKAVKPKTSTGNQLEEQFTDERVTVKRGNHMLELEKGEYVVVGVFNDYEGAEEYSDELFFKGFQTRFGYISEKGDWYVYIYKGDSIEKARQERDKYRKIGAFRKAWIISVQ